MARRRKSDTVLDDLHEIFLHIPSWLCIPLALAAYLGIQVVLLQLASTNPVWKGIAVNARFFGGMAAVLILMTGLKAAISKWQRRRLYDQQTGIESVRNLSWSQFELLIGEAYRRLGYQVTENGGGGADGGIDLVLRGHGRTTIVQCKQWKVYKVGVKPIRELLGVLVSGEAHGAIFVTSGVYTREARDFARGKPIELVDGEQLCQLIAPVRHQQVGRDVVQAKTASTPDAGAPECPLCGGLMILRTARKGVNAGSQFWVCSSFSRSGCKGKRAVA